MEFPYKAEYAKSGRSSCRGCKSAIAKGSLRLAVMVQSPMFDGKTPNWYHHMCFFSKQRPKSVDDIENFESLRLEDQKKIKEKITAVSSIVVPDKKGKKRDATALAAKKSALKDFRIEYAKSGRATCRGCEQKIMKDEIRIAKKDFETEVGMKYGGQDMWHHLTCFATLRSELGYFESADKLPGFKVLSKNDQADAKKELPAIKQEDVPDVKKLKNENLIDGFTEEQSKQYIEQNNIMYKYRDQLEKHLTKNELSELLQFNDQAVPAGQDRILDRLADIMTFGSLVPCNVCKIGQLVFEKFGYKCTGNLTEWTACNTFFKEPLRTPFNVPSNLAKDYKFLKKYKFVSRTRIVKDPPPGFNEVKKEDQNDQPKVQRQAPPLYNMEFVIIGQPQRGKEGLKKQISKLGGKIITKISGTVMAVISSKGEVEKMGSRMESVKENGIHVVPEEFIDEVPNYSGKIPELILVKSICDWGSDPSKRLPPEPSSSKSKLKSGSIYTSKIPSKMKLTLKGGLVVDPDSGLEHKAHVYTHESDKYTVVLSKTDIQTKKNSYYKLQLLEADKGITFWIFRSWGRIGTTIGSSKVERFDNLYDAETLFRQLYEEKTGNTWKNRHNFKKLPHMFYPVDVDYGKDDKIQSLDATDSSSTLSLPVQNLMRIIFDVNAMQNVMLEFDLDIEKMPLGKVSKYQLEQAYNVLTELQKLIQEDSPQEKFIDASNRFYTYLPHSFGVKDPPVMNSFEDIRKKLLMLESLLELEIAYNLMKSSGSENNVDGYYKQLKSQIDVLNKDSEEFKMIQEYVTNTHAETHNSYTLDIKDVFRIKRKGEERRFKPFKQLHNHKLLWHGSRTTNYAGILAKGLRIAPREAPVTGYMFGKGIYFADMVSKSANYCCTTPSSPTGLLLLCDVALGDMYEKTQSEYVEKLPKGKHSTKGIGRTEPDPKAAKIFEGIEVPLGKASVNNKLKSELLYNEYIVYDIAQVNLKYLLVVDFKYKY